MEVWVEYKCVEGLDPKFDSEIEALMKEKKLKLGGTGFRLDTKTRDLHFVEGD